jgi:hypothetical protein
MEGVVCLRPGCQTAIDLMGGGRVAQQSCKHSSQPGIYCVAVFKNTVGIFLRAFVGAELWQCF